MPTYTMGEKPVYAGRAKYNRTNGILYLTDKRLFFEYEQGLVTKRTYVSLNMPISDIQNAMAEMPRFGIGPMNKLVIATKRGSQGFGMNRIEFNTDMTPDVWVSKINEVASMTSVSEPVGAGATNVVVEREIVKIPCKYCGNLIDPARDDRCPRCGARPF